jgi:hypothetical protein
MKQIFFFLLILTVPDILISGQTTNFNDSVAVYFQEIKANTAHYKNLWNIDLYGPIILVNPASRKIYANYPDSAGVLKEDGKIYTGLLPVRINVANTSIKWNGRSWAMIMLPLPDTRQDRLDLLSHELFHRSQPALGFHMSNADNNHLDDRDGRTYLRLELEALRQAMKAKTPDETRTHLENALFFRATRYSIFPNATKSENLMELNEGLAAYTGLSMSGRDDQETEKYIEQKLIEFQNFPTFVRSFVYMTTPLYGFILRRSDKYWNKNITASTNLTDYFTQALNLSVPVNLCPECMSQYGAEKIMAEETKREEERAELIASFRRSFIEHPHLDIRLEHMSISFDPRNIIPLEGYGTVYPGMRVADNWGILTVKEGALIGSNWDKVTLSEPVLITPLKVSGTGWVLELNMGYIVEKDSSGGNYSLRKR